MPVLEGWRQARLAAGVFGYLAHTLDSEDAVAAIRTRVEAREANFLRLADESIFCQPSSPHRALLTWAGWDAERLRKSVAAHGLAATLEELRDNGVTTSLDELKGRTPIRRPGLVSSSDSSFANPRFRRRGLTATTSGTASAAPTRVPYDWRFFSEEAALERLLFESHHLLEASSALWLPGLPSVSGLHNVLVHLKFGRPPERWFSQLPVRGKDAVTMGLLRAVGLAFGHRSPLPEPTPLSQASRVAHWLSSARKRAGRAVLKTFATSAVRVAEHALHEGLALDGCVFLVGGEPLTERRQEFIRSTGATVFARYVATETGWIAGACPHAGAPDAMHLYSDRLAVVAGHGESGDGTAPFLFTTLSPNAGLVLLNTDIGDMGRIGRRPCTCPLGTAGLELELSGVHGHDKLSADGMTLPASTLTAVLDEAMAAAGGAPDSYQLREEHDAKGEARLVILLAPEATIDESELVAAVLERLPEHGHAAGLASTLWRQSGLIEVRRQPLELSPGAKLTMFSAGAP